jgi:hypothetical protein
MQTLFKRMCWILFFALLPQGMKAAAADDSVILAVFDVENKGVRLGPDVMDRLTNYLAGQMALTGVFQVVPREQLKARLSQQRTASYKTCFDQSCQIEIGKELAAQKALTGQVIRLGSKCTVVLVLINLKKAATERGASREGVCSEDGIAQSLKEAALELTSKKTAPVVSDDSLAQRKPDPEKKTLPDSIPPPAGGNGCQIILPEEGCPGNSSIAKIFEDNYENAGSDETRCMRRGIDYYHYCGNSQVVTARFYSAGKMTRQEQILTPSRCEVTMPPEGCPGVPSLQKIFNDNYENAGSDQARCIRRGVEYFNWCGNSQPVTVRYYSNGKLVQQELGSTPTHCQISLAPEVCPAHPGMNLVFNDNYENAGSNQVRCLLRAGEYYVWCASRAPVKACFFSGSTLVQEQTYSK